MKDLVFILYLSSSVKLLSQKDLRDLLDEIAKFNEKKQITGLLLYHQGNFVQIIEGTRDHIQSTFNKIKLDQRHRNVTKLIEREIDERLFPSWRMGFQQISDDQANKIPGYLNYMNKKKINDHLSTSPKEIKILFESFIRVNK